MHATREKDGVYVEDISANRRESDESATKNGGTRLKSQKKLDDEVRSNAVFTGLSKDSHDSLKEPLDDSGEVWNIALTRGGHAVKFVASLVWEVWF